RAISSSEFGCINASQLSDTTLREFTLTGTFTLNDSKCVILTYFEYGQQTFHNIKNYDSLSVPVTGWVMLNGTIPDTLGYPTTNTPHIPDSTIKIVTACLGKPKTISPMISDINEGKDSLFIELANINWVDTSSDTFPTLQYRNFLGYHSKSYPIPANQYSVSN